MKFPNIYPDSESRTLRAALAEDSGLEAKYIDVFRLHNMFFSSIISKVFLPAIPCNAFMLAYLGSFTSAIVYLIINDDDPLKILNLPMLVVLDEAYVEFSGLESRMKWVKQHENLIVLRTFSKRAGDESSFEKSVNDFEHGNLSDCEDMSPTSRHSWDYDNRFGSPYSISSFSRASCSPESSVCREAKKRLFERWALMSNGSNHKPRKFHRSSSTLGEMLALSEIKKPEMCEEDSDNKDEYSRASTSCLNSSVAARENGKDSSRNLLRSKSVPISSTAYGERPNVEVSVPVVCKVDILGEKMKVKAQKTSFAGKVTSLFFLKSKKSRKVKSGKLQSNDDSQSATVNTSGLLAPPERTSNDHSEVVSSPSEMCSGTILVGMNDKKIGQGFHQGALFKGDQDQPSPISVLEHSFDDDEGAKLCCSLSFDPHR